MHWEKEIRVRITIRRIVIAVLATSTVANLVIVGAAVGADSPAATLTVTSTPPRSLLTTPVTIFTSLPGETATTAATQIASAVPTDEVTPTPTPTDSLIWIVCIKKFYWPAYHIKPGDTLFALALATGSTVKELASANCLTSSQIYVGQELYVPRLPVTITPTLSITPTATQTLTATVTPSQTSTDTATASATMTNSPTATPSQTASYTPTNTPTATSTTTTPAAFCDHAEFIADVTFPSGTILLPGQRFTKTWRFRNIGFCTWTPSYTIVWTDGEQFSAPDVTPLPTYVAPGQTVDVSIEMIAPSIPRSYSSYWMFKNPSGAVFGIGPQANESWTMEIIVSDQTPTDIPTIFENPTGYPACNGSSTIYFSVTPLDPQDIRSVTVLYVKSKGFLTEVSMAPDGTRYYGEENSITEPITYFFRAVDGLGTMTDSDTYQFSIRCP